MYCPNCGRSAADNAACCPHCGERINVFGESHIDEVAEELGIPVLGKLPMDPSYAENADYGICYKSKVDALEAAEALLCQR